MLDIVRNSRRLALVIGAFAILAAIAILWFCSFRSATKVSASLAPDDVRQIVGIVSKSRWEWIRRAVAKHDFKFLRHFVLTRTYWINADSGTTGKAAVLYRGTFDSGRVLVRLGHDSTNGWRLESMTFLPYVSK